MRCYMFEKYRKQQSIILEIFINENFDSIQDFIDAVNSIDELYEKGLCLSATTVSEWLHGEENITTSKYYDYAMSVLNPDCKNWIEATQPFIFNNLLDDEKDALMYNFHNDIKAFHFVMDFLKDELTVKRFSDNTIKNCKKTDKKNYNKWYVFSKDSQCYIASVELLNLLCYLYIDARISFYFGLKIKQFSKKEKDSRPEIKKELQKLYDSNYKEIISFLSLVAQSNLIEYDEEELDSDDDYTHNN